MRGDNGFAEGRGAGLNDDGGAGGEGVVGLAGVALVGPDRHDGGVVGHQPAVEQRLRAVVQQQIMSAARTSSTKRDRRGLPKLRLDCGERGIDAYARSERRSDARRHE